MSETDERIYGWKCIADALSVSERQAQNLADPWRKFRLPVRKDYRGIYIKRHELRRFQEDNDVPWGHERVARQPSRKTEPAQGPES